MSDIREEDLRELQPYPDRDVPAALLRLLESPLLERIRALYFKTLSQEEFRKTISSIRTSADFQKKVIAPAIDAMLAAASSGFTISGMENLRPEHRYTFISNHRDIICDPALFTYGLVRAGWPAPLICLGDNLLKSPWIVDLVKVNRGVTVKRNLSQRELLRWSQALSILLNRSVRGNEASVWIAQREGRAKDGDDETHSGVIKMLTLSRDECVVEKARALRIVPLSISYEYDPCDAMKARELHYARTPEGYRKRPGEDEQSMALGIRGNKGRIHLSIGTEITDALDQAARFSSRREQVEQIVLEVDRQIHSRYRLWPSNCIAFDLLEGSKRMSSFYTDQERDFFLTRMEKQLESLGEAPEAIDSMRLRLIEMYAMPVRNSLKWKERVGTDQPHASAEGLLPR